MFVFFPCQFWRKVHDSSRQQGPFATFKLQYDRTCEWTGLKFSNDGKLILLSTNGGTLRILDAFKGAVLHSFVVREESWNILPGIKLVFEFQKLNLFWSICKSWKHNQLMAGCLCVCFVFMQGYNNSKGVTLEASFTPDSQFVMIGKKIFSFGSDFAHNLQ